MQCGTQCVPVTHNSGRSAVPSFMHVNMPNGIDEAECCGTVCNLQNKLQRAQSRVDQLAEDLKALHTQQAGATPAASELRTLARKYHTRISTDTWISLLPWCDIIVLAGCCLLLL